MTDIDTDVVLITVITLAVFLGPPCIHVVLPQLRRGRVLLPFSRRLAFFKRGVLIPCIPLNRHQRERRIDHLPVSDHLTAVGQLVVERLERLPHRVLVKLRAVTGNGGTVRNRVTHGDTKKTHDPQRI